MKPKRDWKIIISIFGVLALLIMIGGIFMINQLKQGTFFEKPAVADDSKILNQKKIVQHMNDLFEKKKSDYSVFQENIPVFVDPSL